MAKVQLNIRVDERIINAMAGMEKSIVVRTALANHLRLDLDTLTPLVEIEMAHEERRLSMRQVAKPLPKPKTWRDCPTTDAMVAYQEAEGYVLGADPKRPDMWFRSRANPHSAHHPITSHWHYDDQPNGAATKAQDISDDIELEAAKVREEIESWGNR